MTEAEREARALSARMNILARLAGGSGLKLLEAMLASPGQVNHSNIIKEMELLASQTDRLVESAIRQLIADYRAYYMPGPTQP